MKKLTVGIVLAGLLAAACVGESSVPGATADGLNCATDLRESAVYDFSDSPPSPDGASPEEAVANFFAEGLPDDVRLIRDGSTVSVMDGEAAVARVQLKDVPGGFVVMEFDACEGAIAPA